MSFAESFLDGFDLLNKRVEGGLKSCSEFATFYKNFAKNEKEYAKSLVKLASNEKKEFQKAHAASKEVGSTFSVWEGIFGELEKKAEFHNQLATKIENELCLSITNFIKEKTKTKKKLEMDTDRLRKDLKMHHENLSKSKTKYVAAMKEAEAQEKACNDPKINPSNIPKMETKRRQLVEKGEQADRDYQNVLSITNQKQSEYYQSTMPSLLREFQDFEEERIRYMKEQSSIWCGWSAEESTVMATIFTNVRNAVESINIETDIRAYCSEFATGVSQPPDIEYQPYEGEGVGTPRGTTRANTPQQKKGNTPSKFGNQQKVWGLQAGDENLSEEDKYNKLAGQNEELEKLIASESKSKDGLENLVRFYGNDPVSKKKAEEELAESESKIAKLREEQGKVVKQMGGSSSASEQPSSSYNSYQDSSSDLGGIRMRALYDYYATAETELSFNEGDILLITNQDDDAWWYAELNGNAGFVPNNYVQAI